MKQFLLIVKRNIKMYFKDKGLFISSLITPLILLVLYATFLAKVYKDSFTGALPEGLEVADKLINGCVGGELLSSILAVCSVTVAFCSNIIMIQDKFLSSIKDFNISPVKRAKIALGYLAATFVSTLIVCSITCALGFVYLANGLVSVFFGRVACFTRRSTPFAFRYGIVLHYLHVFIYAGAGVGGGHNSFCRIRIFVRSLYAHFLFRRRLAKSFRFSSRHLRHFARQKSFPERRFCRNEQNRIPCRGCRRY